MVLVTGAPAVAEPPRAVSFSGCTGWQSGAYWVGANPPPANPPSWGTDSPAGSRVVMEAWTCERIGIGPFERPVSMVLEYTDAFSPPAACRGTSANYSLISWAINDTELVDYFAALAAPAYHAQIIHSQQSLQAVETHEWSWGPPGQTPSTMTIVDDDNQVLAARPTFRYFWATATGAAALEIDFQGNEPMFGERVAFGQLAPPMQLANTPLHAELGALYTDTAGDGKIHYWSDLTCGS